MASRAENRARTRADLVTAARALFARDGFEATTADEIADAAGVSRRTLFRYFATKDEFVFADHAERIAAFESALAGAPRGASLLGRIRHACLVMAERFERDRAWVVAQFRLVNQSPALVARELELDRDYETIMARELAGGARDADSRRRARVIAGATMGAVRATLRVWFEGGGRGDLLAMGTESFELLAGLDQAVPKKGKR